MTDQDEVVDCMTRCKGENQPFALATVVRTENLTAAKAGAKAVIRADGSIVGWIGGGCAQGAVKRAAAEALADGETRLIRVEPEDILNDDDLPEGVEGHVSHCPSRGTADIFIEPVLPRPSLVIAGASPVARSLAGLAGQLGYVVTVAAQPEDQELFDAADERLVGFDIAGLSRIENSFVIVATQGKRDREALRCALQSTAPFVAFVGSRRKAEALKAALLEDGVDAARLADLKAPAGLDLGAVTPDEIALSVLAEVVQARRRKGVAVEDHSVGVAPQALTMGPGADTRTGNVSAVLLAAGQSRRMGDSNKLLLEIDGVPMIRHSAKALLASGVGEVVAVVGHENEAVAKALEGLPVKCVFNPDYEEGQMTSVRAGLESLVQETDGVMICLGDQPMLMAGDYDSMIRAYQGLDQGKIAVPEYQGARGNPIVMPIASRQNILERDVNFGCRNLIRDNPDLVEVIEVKNSNYVRDIDTPEDYSGTLGLRLEAFPLCC
jgi:xanthine dehydrogenase accessory factor